MSKRMFSTKIVNSDPFFDMPVSTQLLYYHLGMHCDDDGFVYPKSVMRMMGASDDDLKILVAKKFFLEFESGVILQKHWRVNNTIRSDKYIRTAHQKEMSMVLPDKGGVYRLTNSKTNGEVGTEPVHKEVIKELINKGESFLSLKDETNEKNEKMGSLAAKEILREASQKIGKSFN